MIRALLVLSQHLGLSALFVMGCAGSKATEIDGGTTTLADTHGGTNRQPSHLKGENDVEAFREVCTG